MTRPVVSDATEKLYAALEPFAALDEGTGYTLLDLCAALVSSPIDQIHGYVTDTDEGPGWQIVLDPENGPAEVLPWLAQLVGVEVTPSMDTAAIRAAILLPRGFQRGTPAALEQAVKATLTGGQRVLIDERWKEDTETLIFSWRDLMARESVWSDVIVDYPTWGDMPTLVPNAYLLRVRTFEPETPDADATEAAILEQKPIGLVLTYGSITGQDWADLQGDHASWTATIADYPTWLDALSELP